MVATISNRMRSNRSPSAGCHLRNRPDIKIRETASRGAGRIWRFAWLAPPRSTAKGRLRPGMPARCCATASSRRLGCLRRRLNRTMPATLQRAFSVEIRRDRVGCRREMKLPSYVAADEAVRIIFARGDPIPFEFPGGVELRRLVEPSARDDYRHVRDMGDDVEVGRGRGDVGRIRPPPGRALFRRSRFGFRLRSAG